MKSSLEIAQKAELEPIGAIGEGLGLLPEEIEPYGRFKAKVSLDAIERLSDRPDAKLICVAGMTPTKAGEGKTTTSVALTEGMGYIGRNPVLCLREPSLGPVFGIKGEPPAAASPRWCRWRTSICTSPATSMRSAPPTTCWRRCWTPRCCTATPTTSTPCGSPGSAPST